MDNDDTSRRPDVKQIHTAEQLTGYMRTEAGNTVAFFKGLIDGGLYRHEALDLVRLQVTERFRAIYTAKPTLPPPER